MGFLKSLGKVASLGMDPKDLLKGGAIAGGVGLLGSMGGGALVTPLLGGAMSAYGADQATKKQIKWERERAQNAHQWEVQDLINAGLNPILSAGGSGAVTGGISAPVPDFSAIANSGAEIARIKNENKLAKAEVENKQSQTGLNQVNAELGELQKELTRAQTASTAQQARKAQADAELAIATLNAETPRLEAKGKYNRSKVGKVLNYLNFGMNDVNPLATGAIGLLLGGGIKAFKNSSTAKQAMKNDKWVKSILMDAKAGQVALPIIK